MIDVGDRAAAIEETFALSRRHDNIGLINSCPISQGEISSFDSVNVPLEIRQSLVKKWAITCSMKIDAPHHLYPCSAPLSEKALAIWSPIRIWCSSKPYLCHQNLGLVRTSPGQQSIDESQDLRCLCLCIFAQCGLWDLTCGWDRTQAAAFEHVVADVVWTYVHNLLCWFVFATRISMASKIAALADFSC